MDGFENIRNSFRLLYLFTRRVLDLMKYIKKQFNIEYIGGYPLFSKPSPGNGGGLLDNWAWDWLNFYFYEFKFEKENIKLSIILQSDTGMWDKKDVKYYELDKFEVAAKSKTKLIFVFKNNGSLDIDDKVTGNETLIKGNYKNKDVILDNDNNNMYCMVFNINEFQNKKLTDNSLKKFINYLNENSIFDITPDRLS